MARVVYTDENYQTIYVDVNAQHPEVTIGRQQDNMLRIASKAISRHHAKIVFQNGRYILMDLGSSNGCYVNNTRVTQQEIHPGEKIRCGSIPLDFIDEPRGAAPAAPRPNMPQPAPNMPGPNVPQRPNMPQAPAFNSSGPAFVANNMSMNNGPMGPMAPSSMNNSAVGPMAPGPMSSSINNGAPMPPGPLSGNMPSAPSGAGIKMGMNAPKLQMFSPGIPASGSSAAPSGDMRNINIRPITGNGNFRPTMINQPSYDQNMERIAQQSQQQTPPPQMRPGQAGPMLPPLGIGGASPAAPSIGAAPAAPAMPPTNSPLPPLGPDPFEEPKLQDPEPNHDEFGDNFNDEFNDNNDQFVDDGLDSSPNDPVDPNDPQNNFPPANEPDPSDTPDPSDNPLDDHFAAAGRPRYNTRDNALGRRAQPRSATGRMDSNVSLPSAASPSSQHPAVASANARRPQNQRGRMAMHNGRMPSMHDDYLDEMAPADNFEMQDQTNADFQDNPASFQDDNRQNVLDAFEDAAKEEVRRSSSQFPAYSENDSIDDLRAKLNDAMSDLRSLRHQLDDAEAAKMEAEADLEALRDGNDAIAAQNPELQNKLDETQALLDAKIKENERIYALLQEAEDARDAALNAAAGGDSAADALNQEIASLRAKNDETLAELQKTQQDLSDAQDDKAEALLSLKELEAKSQNYKTQADQAQFDLANVRANAEAFQAQIAELQKQNDDKDALIAELRAELDQKNNELLAASNHDDLDNLNVELAQTKAELGNVSAEFSSVKAALNAANEAKIELQKALDVARSSAANPAVSASSNASADFVKTWAPKFDSVIGYAQNVVSLIDGMPGVDPAASESIHSMFDVLRLCDKKIKKAAKTLS